MSNKNTTKRALALSVISMLICVIMLAGTTFAWFTDSVQSGRNVIAAGNLDVELYHNGSDDVKGDTALFTDVNGKSILWEPGVVTYENFTVKNVGTLALKYQLDLTIFDEQKTPDGKSLSDVIKVAYVENGVTGTDRNAIVDAIADDAWVKIADIADSDTLYPVGNADGEKSEKTTGVVLYWEPTANDNDYNMNNEWQNEPDLFIEFGLTLVATQLEYEEDSFDETYDADAYFPGDAAGQSKTNNLAKQFSEAKDGDTIYLEPLNYGLISLGSGAYPYDYPANLTLVGQEGTAFTGFSINDEVINGWTFKNIDFIGDKTDNSGNTDGISVSTKATVKGITLVDCNFSNGATFSMINTTNATFEDVVVNNCTFNNVEDKTPALLLQGVTDITVDKCTFTDAGYNAIQTNSTKGEFVFTNNVINGTTDRAIRVSNKGANVTVTGNTIVTDGDDDGELMKISGLTGTETITLSGNTWNGKADAEMVTENDGTNYVVK